MAVYTQFAHTPLPTDIPVKNYGLTDLSAGYVVIIDTTNYVGGTAAMDMIGVKFPAADGVMPAGVLITNVPAGGTGLMRTQGTAQCWAQGTVTVGDVVDVDGSAGDEGQVHTHVGAKAQVGIALTTAADLDPVLVLVCMAFNA